MHKQIGAAVELVLSFVVLTLSSGQSFAQTNVGVQQNCTTKIMCCINGKCYDPSTPIGYTCNNGGAQTVTTCTKPPNKANTNPAQKGRPCVPTPGQKPCT
jgi:hypothetical protein